MIIGVWKFPPQFFSNGFQARPMPEVSCCPALKAEAKLCKSNGLIDSAE